MEKTGRARIEASKEEQLSIIEKNKQEALAKLNIKHAAADKVKTSFGYIGIVFLSFLWGSIILNDLTKFLQLCFEIAKDLLKEKRELKEKKTKEEKRKEYEQVTLEMDEEYSQDLEDKLHQFHLQLVKACAKKSASK